MLQLAPVEYQLYPVGKGPLLYHHPSCWPCSADAVPSPFLTAPLTRRLHPYAPAHIYRANKLPPLTAHNNKKHEQHHL